jgi:hypothetical protein
MRLIGGLQSDVSRPPAAELFRSGISVRCVLTNPGSPGFLTFLASEQRGGLRRARTNNKLGQHMDASGRRSWVRATIIVAVAYAVIGIVFAALDKSTDANHVHPWRLAAWVASGAVATAHIGYEHYRLGSSPRPTALHVAGAVALGAFGLALAANVHWLFAETHGQRSPLLALPLWPLITAIPAFLVALVVAAVLARFSRRA